MLMKLPNLVPRRRSCSVTSHMSSRRNLGQLKRELSEVEGENAGIDCEIEELQRRCMEDYDKMDSELEKLSCWLEFIESQMLELSHQIEKIKTSLKSLQDLNSIIKRFEAVEKFEDALTGLRIIEIEGNSIRLSLKTYIPYLESVLRH